MPDFQKLFQEVLRQRPQLTDQVLRRMVDEKKKRVGGGYLTDQGSLFLVAAELGVSLESVATSDLALKDAYIGASEISLPCRVFAIYPTKTYKRKTDGGEGKYRRLVVYDKDDYLKVTLWDENCDLVEKLGLKVGSAIRLVKGYVKSGIDGRPVLNLGNRGSIEILNASLTAGTTESEFQGSGVIPKIETKILPLSQISAPGQFLCIKARVKGQPKTSEFTRQEGTKGTVTQLLLSDSFSQGSLSSPSRLVLWDYSRPVDVKENQVVMIYNARGKLLPHGEIEFHGDESTEIVAVEEKPFEASLRILNKVGYENYAACVGVDKQGKVYSVSARGNAAQKITKEIDPGKIVVLRPKRNVGDDLRIFIDGESEVDIIWEGDADFPTHEQFLTKVDRLNNAPRVVFLEVMALSNSVVQDVGTKDGTIVKRGEVTVGDETGEVRLVAWRNQTDALAGIHTGEKLSLKSVEVQSRDGRISLLLRPYTSISKI